MSCYLILHPGPSITLHDLLLSHATSLDRVQGKTKDGYRQGYFLVARYSSRQNHTASLALSVNDRATITFGTTPDATKREKTRSRRLAAALHVHATNTGLPRCEENGKQELLLETIVRLHERPLRRISERHTFPEHPMQSQSL